MKKIDIEKKAYGTAVTLLEAKGFVSPVDLFMKMGRLSKKDYEDWRFGRVPYLEKVLQGNLRKLSLVMKTLRKFTGDYDLKPSCTGYNKWGKDPKKRLRFSASQHPEIEKAYATHYVKSK